MSTKLSFSAILAEFLVAIGEGEQNLEDARQNVSEILEYNPATLFNRINRNNNGKITADEIINFCADNGLATIEKDETQLLIDFFDDSGDGVLDFEEFSHILLPCEDMELREAVLSRNSFESIVARGEYLNDDVEHSVVKIFDREITLIRTLVKNIRELCWWNYTECDWFRLIGPQNQLGSVNVQMLDKFLRSQGKIQTDMDLLAIVRRMDANGDAEVSFSEWCQFLKLHGYTWKPPVVKIEVHEVPAYYPVYVPVPEVREPVLERKLVERPVYHPQPLPVYDHKPLPVYERPPPLPAYESKYKTLYGSSSLAARDFGYNHYDYRNLNYSYDYGRLANGQHSALPSRERYYDDSHLGSRFARAPYH